MRGYWIHYARANKNARPKCGYYNAYLGYKSSPSRVDVRCRRCGARVQFNPHKKYETRGKHRQAIFISKSKWSDNQIIAYCLVVNAATPRQRHEGFVTASELIKNKSDSQRRDKQ